MAGRLREAAISVGHSVAQSFVFTGRSRRLDVGYYWLACALLGGLAHAAAQASLSWNGQRMADWVVGLVLTIPAFGLLARRFHDHGRTGWWVLLLPPMLALNLYKEIYVNFHASDPAWPDLLPWDWALLPLGIFLLAMIVMEGEIGPNRYGPDPRLEEENAARA